MSKGNQNETRFTLSNGDIAYFSVPWSASPKDCDLVQELVSLQLESIRKYRERLSTREEWWLKNRHLGP
jgi:hypothetical protein